MDVTPGQAPRLKDLVEALEVSHLLEHRTQAYPPCLWVALSPPNLGQWLGRQARYPYPGLIVPPHRSPRSPHLWAHLTLLGRTGMRIH